MAVLRPDLIVKSTLSSKLRYHITVVFSLAFVAILLTFQLKTLSPLSWLVSLVSTVWSCRSWSPMT